VQHALGQPGKPPNRRSPFFIGMIAAAGVAVMVGTPGMIITVRDVLIPIGLALFLAIGLEPAVPVLARHQFPRWAAVITVLTATLAAVGGFPRRSPVGTTGYPVHHPRPDDAIPARCAWHVGDPPQHGVASRRAVDTDHHDVALGRHPYSNTAL
jgi:hypothetical protein